MFSFASRYLFVIVNGYKIFVSRIIQSLSRWRVNLFLINLLFLANLSLQHVLLDNGPLYNVLEGTVIVSL